MKQIIILLGIPGSGKGTQAEIICDTYGYGHISTGNLLRVIDADPNASSEDKAMLVNMKNGGLVPDEFIYRIAFDAIKGNLDAGRGVVLDGAIRNIAQAERYQKFFAELGVDNNVVTIEIALDDATATDRILNRAKENGGVRADDTPAIIAERMKRQGNSVIAPIRDYYANLGILQTVDGSKDIDGVRTEIAMILSNSNV